MMYGTSCLLAGDHRGSLGIAAPQNGHIMSFYTPQNGDIMTFYESTLDHAWHADDYGTPFCLLTGEHWGSPGQLTVPQN